MKEKIVIVGYGDFGRETADWLMLCHSEVAGFIDDVKAAAGPGERLLGTISEYQPQPDHRLLISISDPQVRKRYAQTLTERGCQFTTMGCEVDTAPSASWGEGTIACPRSLISARARVGIHCHLNVHATVGHDVQMGDYCTVSSHVDICGRVELGECVFIGSGARILPGFKVGANARIGAGAIVMRDVPEGATVYAEAARML